MAFQRRIVEISQAFKDWLSQNFSDINHIHTKYEDYEDSIQDAAFGSMPDFSRALYLYNTGTTNDDTTKTVGIPIYKQNVPGYWMSQQCQPMNDSDWNCVVSHHPGYLYCPIVANTYDVYNTNDGTKRSVTKPITRNNCFIMFGDGASGSDDSRSTGYSPILPGTSTYVVIKQSQNGQNQQAASHHWIFVPCMGVPANVAPSSFVTLAGRMYSNKNAATTDTNTDWGIISNARAAFTGSWKDNLAGNVADESKCIKFYKILVTDNHDNWSDRAFWLIDPVAMTGASREWVSHDNTARRIGYNSTAGRWEYKHNATVYWAANGSGTDDPWTLTWYKVLSSRLDGFFMKALDYVYPGIAADLRLDANGEWATAINWIYYRNATSSRHVITYQGGLGVFIPSEIRNGVLTVKITSVSGCCELVGLNNTGGVVINGDGTTGSRFNGGSQGTKGTQLVANGATGSFTFNLTSSNVNHAYFGLWGNQGRNWEVYLEAKIVTTSGAVYNYGLLSGAALRAQAGYNAHQAREANIARWVKA